MQIKTPDFLNAQFFMKNDIPENIDVIPRISPSQVHSTNIIHVNENNFMEYASTKTEADGILLTTTKAAASLRFADCAPVMIYGRNWVTILHSGYKGTMMNISGRAVDLLRDLYGEEEIYDSFAWIGPCIGKKYYCRDLVNDENTQWGLKCFHSENYEIINDKVYFDLAGEIKAQLIDGEIKPENILLSGIDTYTDNNCYSYRKGDKTERMMLYVRLID